MTHSHSYRTAFAISLGAIVGANARYAVVTFVSAQFGESFAYIGTLSVNVIGCFIIALFLTVTEQRFSNLPPEVRLLVVTGFCGAFTTFSTYGLDTVALANDRNLLLAMSYWAGSPIVGMAAVLLGVAAGRLWR